jgi:antitoxin HicB
MKSKSVLAYPATFTPEEKGIDITFPDFPRAHSCGQNAEEAYRMAVDCLHAAIEYALDEKAAVPAPSKIRKGQHAIPVALGLAPKLALFQLMRELNVSNSKLAERMNASETVVRRMLNPSHKSKPEQYTRALAALGAGVEVSLVHHYISRS